MIFRLFLWSAVYAIPALTVAYPLVEYDTGWHLATGRWIIENRAIPTHDPFSTVPGDRPWIAYSWLYGVFLYGVHGLLGLHGILWFRTLMALVIVASLHRFVARRQPDQRVTAVIVAAAALALTRVLVAERPGLFSVLFCLWTLEAIEQVSGKVNGSAKLWFWLLPLIYAFWANVHIQFVHGLFLLGLGWVSGEFFPARGEQGADGTGPNNKFRRFLLAALILLCLLATLVNPYHLRLYDVILTYGGQKSTYELFTELKSIEFRHYADWVLLGMFAATCFVLGRRRSRDVFELLVLASTAYFGFHSRHDCWLLVLGTTLILARAACGAASDAKPQAALTWTEVFAVAGVIALVCTAVSLTRPKDFLQDTWKARFPVEASQFIADTGYAGPIYNPIHWGGYLIWRLPEYRVGIDGRAQLHGDERIRRFDATWHGIAGWHDDPDLLAAGIVVVERNCPLASLLRQDTRFVNVHEDDVAVVFTNRAQAGKGKVAGSFVGP